VNLFKRTLATTAALLSLNLAASPASAESYFGVRLETISILPVFGIQYGYDFDSANPTDGRAGIRIGAESFFGVINRVTLDGLYRFSGGSSAYAGGGAGLVFAGNTFGGGSSGTTLIPEVHGLIGYEFAIASTTALYLEGEFGVAFTPQYNGTVGINPIGSFSVGLNLKF
jgi:hypothetical protein